MKTIQTRFNQLKSILLTPFNYSNGINKVAFYLFLLINLIVLFNVVSHSPRGIYDRDGHMELVFAYSEGRIPDVTDGREYHSAYLPYLIPAAAYKISNELQLNQVFTLDDHQDSVLARRIYQYFLSWHDDPNYAIAAKAGQFQMFFVSIGITYLLAVLCKKIMQENPIFQVVSLATLGILPVYYRSLSMIRGEPYLAFFLLSTLLFTINIYNEKNASLKNILFAGLSIGFAVLSRHMGLILGPMIAIYALILVILKEINLRYFLKTIFPIGIIAILLAATFFVPYLYNNDYAFFPKAEAFNNYPSTFSFSNISPDYFTDFALDTLFIDPVRPEFSNTFFPILYADTFGDYWGYFLIRGIDIETGKYLGSSTLSGYYYDFLFLDKSFPPEKFNWETNRYEMGIYLGVINALSLPILFMFIHGFFLAIQSVFQAFWKRSQIILSGQGLIVTLLFGNFLMFLYLVIRYGGNEMVKATYILHVFPLLSILSGYSFTQIQKLKKIPNLLIYALVIIIIFRIPSLFSHWTPWW